MTSHSESRPAPFAHPTDADDPIRRAVNDLERGVAEWQGRGWPAPDVMVVAGSGLGVSLGEPAYGPLALSELLPFPAHTVVGHAHQVEILEPAAGRHVAYFRGRLHYYQGYDPNQVVYTVRLAALLGVKVLILTNASGGVNESFRPGELKRITDHLNLTGVNPLRGELPEEWGPRFPDMTEAYDKKLGDLVARHAEQVGVDLGEGVYAALTGPTYETPAEVRMLRTLGADLTGMSTVLENIAARHMGVKVVGISLVSNPAAGVADGPLDHQEVLDAGRAAAGDVAKLLKAVLADPGLV